MKAKISLLTCALLLGFYLGYAQQILTLTGKVIDSESKKPVAFASVGIQGKSLGTITNEEGEFDLHLPEGLRTHRLFITCMGYEGFALPVNQWDVTTRKIVELKPATYQLAEVEVQAKKPLTAREIVQQARHNIANNYPDKPFKMSAYFRTYLKVNDRYTWFTDAALDIYDKGYGHAPFGEQNLQEQVVLKGVRQSYWHNPKGYVNAFDEKQFDNYNPIWHLLVQNAVRYRSQALNLRQYEYTLDSLIWQDGKQLYVIGAGIKHKKFLQYGRIDNTIQPAYQLFIDKNSFAIHKIVYKPVPLPITRHEEVIDLMIQEGNDSIESYNLGSKFLLVMEYKEWNGKMYPSYIITRSIKEDYHKGKGQVIYRDELLEELVLNAIETENIGLPEQEKVMNSKQNLIIQAPPYQPEFWKKYNMVKLSSLDKQLLEDLAKGKTLEEQFSEVKSPPEEILDVKYHYVNRSKSK
jgi:hypothetical protein